MLHVTKQRPPTHSVGAGVATPIVLSMLGSKTELTSCAQMNIYDETTQQGTYCNQNVHIVQKHENSVTHHENSQNII